MSNANEVPSSQRFILATWDMEKLENWRVFIVSAHDPAIPD